METNRRPFIWMMTGFSPCLSDTGRCRQSCGRMRRHTRVACRCLSPVIKGNGGYGFAPMHLFQLFIHLYNRRVAGAHLVLVCRPIVSGHASFVGRSWDHRRHKRYHGDGGFCISVTTWLPVSGRDEQGLYSLGGVGGGKVILRERRETEAIKRSLSGVSPASGQTDMRLTLATSCPA